MLASAMSSSRSGARLHHSDSRWASDQRVVAEHQAVRREVGAVDIGRDGRVDAGQRVLEVGAEGPVRVGVAEQARVRVVVDGVSLGDGIMVGHRGAHMCGTSSGIA